MSDDGSTDERSALGWVMSGTVGALVVGGLARHLIDRRRERALADADAHDEKVELEKQAGTAAESTAKSTAEEEDRPT